MSQSRTRKAPAAGDGARPRAVTKVSGDAAKKQTQNHHHHHRSANRIPKSVRYELENALVGLCDVWFEDIKPHLLRNNIKVHTHPSETGAGDQRGRLRLPSGAPGCSHLDPGAASDHQQHPTASCAVSCSTLPTASRARCRKPRVPPFKLLSPVHSPARPATPQNQEPTYEVEAVPPRPPRRRRRRHRRALRTLPTPPAPANHVVPRLCRTISSQASCPLTGTTKWHPGLQLLRLNNARRHRRSVLELRIPRCNYLSNHATLMKDKSTQTEKSRWSSPKRSSQIRRESPSSRQSPSPSRQPSLLRPPSPCRRPPKSTNHKKIGAPGTTALFPSPLFQDDLIDLIGESHGKIIERLYPGQKNEKLHSAMNLIQTAQRRVQNFPPWR